MDTASTEMALTGHLRELRRRLIISLLAVFIGSCAGFALWDFVLHVTTDPYCHAQAQRHASGVAGGSSCQLYITDPLQGFTTRLSVAGYLGLMFSSPILLWQIWRFVTPGLHPKEKRYAIPFIIASLVLFFLGVWVAWLTFPRALSFFLAVGGSNVTTLFNPAPYLKLIFLMMVVTGAVFELPVLLVFLEMVRVITSRQLRNWRRYAICLNFVIAAVATPSQDPYSLFVMAVPMCIFYEIAILIGRVLKR